MLRYALTWEDAAVLRRGLAAAPGSTLLSIAAAGDNVLALLLDDPERIIALDYNPAQLAALELRMAAYQRLDHGGLLELLGETASQRRADLYAECRPVLTAPARAYWDARAGTIATGIGRAGRFERYLTAFRRWMLPLVHGRQTVAALLEPQSADERRAFFDARWDTTRWRGLFRVFCSRPAMQRGRDPAYLRHAHGRLADRLLVRVRHAATTLDPSTNPYLRWILEGRYGAALPEALRPEHFSTIRARVERVEMRCAGLGSVVAALPDASVDGFNLSDVFEYLDRPACDALYADLARVARPAARLAYWNLFVPRQRPDALAAQFQPLTAEARRLHDADRAFFYSRFVLETRTETP